MQSVQKHGLQASCVIMTCRDLSIDPGRVYDFALNNDAFVQSGEQVYAQIQLPGGRPALYTVQGLNDAISKMRKS